MLWGGSPHRRFHEFRHPGVVILLPAACVGSAVTAHFGMLRSRRLGRSQNPSLQDPTQIFKTGSQMDRLGAIETFG
jgi:hypothetical protein